MGDPGEEHTTNLMKVSNLIQAPPILLHEKDSRYPLDTKLGGP
jgi:hypothetical protein